MKRDMEMVRRILLEIEETGACDYDFAIRKFMETHEQPTPEENKAQAIKEYHYKLLVRTGWIQESSTGLWIEGLSWEAHDFLDTIREDKRWNRVKKYVKDRGEDITTLPLSTLRAVGEKLVTDLMVSGGTG